MKLLHDGIKHFAIKSPDHCAMIYEDRLFSYKEVWQMILSLASWFSVNLGKKTRVGICLENCPEAVYSMYALSVAGMIVVPLDANMHERNIAYIINDCNVEIMITSQKHLDSFIKTIKGSNLKTVILIDCKQKTVLEGILILPFSDLINMQQGDFKLDSIGLGEMDTAFILYTTGTTGPKKGVMLNHFNLISASNNIIEFMGMSGEIIESLCMPLSHSFGFARLRCVFAVGGTVILENGLLRPEIVLFNVKKYETNAFSAVPAAFDVLLNGYCGREFKKIALQFKFIEIGSAFMRLEHKKMLTEYCPEARICMHYGLTEASRSAFIEFHAENKHLLTVGRPSPNVSIKIIDENGQEKSVNTLGEIAIKGDMVMQGYWGQPELTRKVLCNGWLYSGDLGLVDEEGYLHLMGRREEIINVGGFKVGPGEVEEVLLKFEGISEAAVVGVRNPQNENHQKIRAYLVLRDETKPLDLTKLKKFCLSEIEPYKIPEDFVQIKSLQKTASGKTQRHLLEKGVNLNG